MVLSQSRLSIIPYPTSVIIDPGVFNINGTTVINVNDSSSLSDAELFDEYLNTNYSINLKIVYRGFQQVNCINLINETEYNQKQDSYYSSGSVNSIIILGKGAGVFYGLQTLKQLITQNQSGNIHIPAFAIYDEPRFKWRGMHLDVARHFFPKEFIKKYIDYLAMYKMNMFHWHLTDDQGWRLEIKKYPKLTEVGAWRNATLKGHWSIFPHEFDSTRYGGYYTQDDIREVVEYASKRHIMVVPEIEMPGHSMAILASYPELSCSKGPFEVATEWGVEDNVLCPKEETIRFMEDVLSEVIELFPGKYIHVGGDEVPKVSWKQSEYCQQLMKKEGLKDENELQSYFIKRIETFLYSKGKTMIGWDEILEGGLAPNATVMSWRGVDGGIEAARMDHDVVMTPGKFCYFDHYQGNPKFEPLAIGGYVPVDKVYSYEPVPDSLTDEQKTHILGAQGNLWTEYIADFNHVEYMAFPRICALAEVVWSPKENRNYADFQSRLLEHFKLLDKLGVNYSKSIFQLNADVLPNDSHDGVMYKLSSNFDSGKIYYTTDGGGPTIQSNLYTAPIHINKGTTVKAAYFVDDKLNSGIIEQQFNINKATGKQIELKNEPDKRYNYGGALTLVDGITGVLPWYGKEWLGFSGMDCVATIDLGKDETFSKVTMDVLEDYWSWIWLPTKIELYISSDGIEFMKINEVSADEIKKMKREIIIDAGKTNARYVRIVAENYGKLPSGVPGEGHGAWLFVDEIGIY